MPSAESRAHLSREEHVLLSYSDRPRLRSPFRKFLLMRDMGSYILGNAIIQLLARNKSDKAVCGYEYIFGFLSARA